MPKNDLVNEWQLLAQRGDWEALLIATRQCREGNLTLTAAIWETRALRALQRGAEANDLICTTAQGFFEAGAHEVLELGEELAQCAFYELSAQLAARVEHAGALHAAYLWAILWREKENWVECNKALVRLQGLTEPWPSLARIQRAWALMRQGQIAAARELVAGFVDNAHPGIQKLLARMAIAQGNAQEARQRLEMVAKSQPLDWEWPPLLALALTPELAQTAPQRLLELYATGLQRQPRQSDALVNRARLRLFLGDIAGAEEDTNTALALKPWFDAPILLWVEHAISQRNFSRAEDLLTVARNKLDTPKRASAALDLLRMKGSKFKQVIEAAEKLVQRYPEDAGALRTAGAALQAAKKFDLAARYYTLALERAPADVATINNLAMLYRDRGDPEEAIETWRKIIDRADDTVRINYALSLLDSGERQEPELILKAVLERNPSLPVALRGLSDSYFRGSMDDLAWETIQKALQADPKHPMAWRSAAGIARRREGDLQAIKILEQGERYAQPVLPVRQALFQRWRGILNHADLQARVSAWCQAEPAEVEYWFMLADAGYDAGDFECCEGRLKEAAQRDASLGNAALVRFYLGRDRQGAARRVAEQLVRDDPQTMKHWGMLAEVLHRQERFNASLDVLDEGLKREPGRLSLVRQKVGILLSRERFDEAVEAARELYQLDNSFLALNLLHEALSRAQRREEALQVVSEAQQQHRKNRLIRFMHADCLKALGRHEQALEVLAALYRDEPQNFGVVSRYVRALAAAERLPEALQVIERLAASCGHQPDLQMAMVELMREQGAHDAAEKLLDTLLTSTPNYLPLWQQKILLAKRQQDENAERNIWLAVLERFPPQRWAKSGVADLVRLDLIEPMQKALNDWRKHEPNSPEPYWAAFNAAREMKKEKLALDMLAKIEALRGDALPETHARRANILQENWQIGAALAELRKAIGLRPDSTALHMELLNMLVKAGEFDEFDTLMAKLEHLLGDRRYADFRNFFFNINCHPTWTAAEVWRFYRDWYERAVKSSLPPPKAHANVPDAGRKLRIGYLSPDFRRHAVAYFSEPLLVEHDREQFELYAYAHLDAGQADAYTERYKSYFQHWTETRGMSDDELERTIREHQIDILVDLAGHTSNNRLTLMLRRPAPLQASWIWGAGQTTGLPQVDYFLTDSASVPPEHDAYMAEKVARMSRPGLPFKPAHDVLEPTPLPCLTNGFITFGVLARPLRTNRNTVALWAKILHREPKSILRFDHVPYAEADVQQRLLGYFAEHGITEDRLQFRNTRPHWQVYQEIDLQLDPFPAGSSTTASEGLYMERLVVSLKSRPPMGLIAHGQLKAMGLDEFCTADTEDEYVEKAVALVNDFQRLAGLSAGLRECMKNSWLMDYAGYGREVAVLYRQMWRDWCAKQAGGGA